MQGLIERYKGSNAETQVESSEQNKTQVSSRDRMIHLVISNGIAEPRIRNAVFHESFQKSVETKKISID